MFGDDFKQQVSGLWADLKLTSDQLSTSLGRLALNNSADVIDYEYQLPSGVYLRNLNSSYDNPFTHRHLAISGRLLLIPDQGLVLLPTDKTQSWWLTHVWQQSFWEWEISSKCLSVWQVKRLALGEQKPLVVIQKEIVVTMTGITFSLQTLVLGQVWVIQKWNYQADQTTAVEYLQSAPYVVGAKLGVLNEYPEQTPIEILEIQKDSSSLGRFVVKGSGPQKLSESHVSLFINRAKLLEIEAPVLFTALNKLPEYSLEQAWAYVQAAKSEALKFIAPYVESAPQERYTTSTNL